MTFDFAYYFNNLNKDDRRQSDYSTGDPWTDPRFKYPYSFSKAELDAACREYGLGEWDVPDWDERRERRALRAPQGSAGSFNGPRPRTATIDA